MKRKVWAAILAAIFALSSGTALAHDADLLGPNEVDLIGAGAVDEPGDITPEHFHVLVHDHVIEQSTRMPDKIVDTGIIAVGTNCSYVNSSSYQVQFEKVVDHSYSATGAFDLKLLEATVGYSLTKGTRISHNGTQSLQPRSAGQTKLREHLYRHSVVYRTDYYSSTYPWPKVATEYGAANTEGFRVYELLFTDIPLTGCPS